MSFMSAMYKKLEESNIDDVPVKAGIIAQASLVQALSGGHYNQETKLFKLFYETNLRIIIIKTIVRIK